MYLTAFQPTARNMVLCASMLICSLGFAQTPARQSAAAAAAAAAAARAPQPATAGQLLSQTDAVRVLAGYWRVQWGADDVQVGVLHITAIGASENQVLFEGQYSQDGYNTCAASGNWTYNSRVAYSAGGNTENYEIANLMRLKLNCPTTKKDYAIETVVVVGSPSLSFVGRALINQADRRLTTTINLTRFNSQF